MAQQYGIKIEVVLGTSYGTHWEIEEHFGNLTKTVWELDGKTLRTEKKKSTCPPAPTPNKKLCPPKPSHWLHKISISKTVCHHFQPELMPPL
jgi:hypothetical protein